MPLNTDISYTLIFKTSDAQMNYQLKIKLVKLLKYVQIKLRNLWGKVSGT